MRIGVARQAASSDQRDAQHVEQGSIIAVRLSDRIAGDRLTRLLHGLATRQTARDHVTIHILNKAMDSLDARNFHVAVALLEYARRRTPSDGAIGVALAVTRFAVNDSSAVELLETLTRGTNWRDLWMALIAARMQLGDLEQAFRELQTMLTRIAAPQNNPDIEIASQVSQLTGAPGWCGLDTSGHATICAEPNVLTRLAILFDGTALEAFPSTGPSDQRTGIYDRRKVSLPRRWHQHSRLDVSFEGRNLIGSPIDIAQFAGAEGFVEAEPTSGALRGWCRFPAERERIPLVTIASLAKPHKRLSIRADTMDHRAVGEDEFAVRHEFAVDRERICSLGDAVRITDSFGSELYGSPIRPMAWSKSVRNAMHPVAAGYPWSHGKREPHTHNLAAEPAMPVAKIVPARTTAAPTDIRPVDVVIPVHRGTAVTLACIDSVHQHRSIGERIIVVADGCLKRHLVAALSTLAKRKTILLHKERAIHGFPGAGNIGLRLAVEHDVVLLSADTIVTPGWLAGLRAAVYAAPDIGTATPLSNNAAIFSYPRRDVPNPCPDMAAASVLARLAARVNQRMSVDVPTGHDFCLYIRAQCLLETGLLRDDTFAQGYGEESDFCMRARHLGWRHVAVPSVFVGHHGATSSNAARDDLMTRNQRILNTLHVGYEKLLEEWQAQDPLGESRRNLDLARLHADSTARRNVLLVTHDRAGGILRYINERADALARCGSRAIVLRSAIIRGERLTRIVIGDDDYPNLRFRMPQEQPALLSCLKSIGVREIEVHSLIGHDDTAVKTLISLGIPLDLFVHDYSMFCPRITLTTGAHHYCSEPDIAQCRNCVVDHGSAFDEPVSPDTLVARTRRLMSVARAVIAPSNDAARRIVARFGCRVTVRGWEPPCVFDPVRHRPLRKRSVRVCVVGAISHAKGYSALLECARLVATRHLPIEFRIVGYTCDDIRLLDTGVVQITGPYTESEAIPLIRAQHADFAWVPSVWPETWCYVLTQIWQAGLYAIVHDIGAQSERVRETGCGIVVPLHIPTDQLVQLFAQPAAIRLTDAPNNARRAACHITHLPLKAERVPSR